MPKRDNPEQPDELTRRWSNIENNVAQAEVVLNKLQASTNLQQFIQELTKLLKTVKQIKSDADSCHKLSTQTVKRQKGTPVEQSRPPHQKFAATGVASIPVGRGQASISVGRGQAANQPINLTGIQGGVPTQKPNATMFLPPQHIQQRLVQLQNNANNTLRSAQGAPPSTRPPGGLTLPSPPNPLQRPPLQQSPNYLQISSQQRPADFQQMRVVLNAQTRPPTVSSHQGVHFPPQQVLRGGLPQSLPTALSLQGQLQQQQMGSLTLQQQLAGIAPSSHQPVLPQRSKDQGPLMAPPVILQSVPIGQQGKLQKQQGLELPKQQQIISSGVQSLNTSKVRIVPQSENNKDGQQ